MVERLLPRQYIAMHPRGLWWVTYNYATKLYSLVNAWKGDVSTSDDPASVAAATRLLAGWEPFFRNDVSGQIVWVAQ